MKRNYVNPSTLTLIPSILPGYCTGCETQILTFHIINITEIQIPLTVFQINIQLKK